MSTTLLSMKISLLPTKCRTCPDASVLTISLGTPQGSARMAAVPIVVPAEPPIASTPATSPRRIIGSNQLRPPAAAAVMAAPRSPSATSRARSAPAAAKTRAGNVGRSPRLAQAADVDQPRGHAALPQACGE